MIYDLYLFDHNVLHICFWTLPALIIAAVMIVMAVVHRRNHEKREKEFVEALEEKLKSPEALKAQGGMETAGA